MEKKRTTIYLDEPNLKKLKFLAVENDTTITALIDEAIALLLKKYKK
jgi:hypothetical protein